MDAQERNGNVDGALDPAAMLALADETTVETGDRLTLDMRLVYAVWGVAWTIGLTVRWLASGSDPVIEAERQAWWLANGLMAAALLITIVHIGRRYAGLRGPSALVGQRLGAMWILAFVSLNLLVAGLDRADADTSTLSLVAGVGSVLLVGVLYAADGAIWRDDLQYRLGLWTVAVAGLAGLVGAPDHLLVLAIGGGGGFLLAAAIEATIFHRR